LKLSNFLATNNTEPINLCQHDFQKWQQQPARSKMTAKISRAYFATLGHSKVLRTKFKINMLAVLLSNFHFSLLVFSVIATWRRESMEATDRTQKHKKPGGST
jgi:K+-transporting ATPase A subunit